MNMVFYLNQEVYLDNTLLNENKLIELLEKYNNYKNNIENYDNLNVPIKINLIKKLVEFYIIKEIKIL
jgi:hypothetical protein